MKYHRRRKYDDLGRQLRDRARELGLVAPDTKPCSTNWRRSWTIAIPSTDVAELDALAVWRAENGLPP